MPMPMLQHVARHTERPALTRRVHPKVINLI